MKGGVFQYILENMWTELLFRDEKEKNIEPQRQVKKKKTPNS